MASPSFSRPAFLFSSYVHDFFLYMRVCVCVCVCVCVFAGVHPHTCIQTSVCLYEISVLLKLHRQDIVSDYFSVFRTFCSVVLSKRMCNTVLYVCIYIYILYVYICIILPHYHQIQCILYTFEQLILFVK